MTGQVLLTQPFGPAVATPVLSLPGGAYTGAQTLTVTCATPGATILYNAHASGYLPLGTDTLTYTGPLTINAVSEYLQFIAVLNGSPSSTLVQAFYSIEAQAAQPVFSPAPGTYTGTQTVTMSSSTPGATIRFTTDGSTPNDSSPIYSGGVSVSSTKTLQAIATATGLQDSGVTSGVYTIASQVATPAFSPAAGTYAGTQSVTLSCSTTGSSIYYTTDGSTPTTASTLYSGAISVSSTETIKAIAAAPGYANSAIATAAYSIGSGKAAFLATLNGYKGSKIVSGQTGQIFIGSGGTQAQILANHNAINTQSGQYPAILALIFNAVGPASGAYTIATAKSAAQYWWGQGGIVGLSMYLGCPLGSGPCLDGGLNPNTSGFMSASQLHSMVTPGNAIYTQWQSQLAYYGTQLQAFFASNTGNFVLFRFFIEINGQFGSDWYGGITGGTAFADMQTVQQQAYTYLNVTCGLANNLIWVYSANQNVSNYTAYFPGTAYCDITALDVYADGDSPYNGSNGLGDYLNLGGAYAALTALGLPFGMFECGFHEATGCTANEIDDDWYRQAIQGHAPNTVFFIPFCDIPSGPPNNNGYQSLNSQRNCSAALNNSAIINLAQLPAGGLVYPSTPTGVVMNLQGQVAPNTSIYDSGTGFYDAPYPNVTSINWNAASAGTYPISGYNIYRSTNFATAVKINSSLVTGTSYQDNSATLSMNSVAGSTAPYYTANTYQYYVQAVDNHGNVGSLSTQQIIQAYKNGVKYTVGGDFSGTNGGTVTVNYNDTTHDPNGAILFTWTGNYGYFLPWQGQNVINYNMWGGAQNYLMFDFMALTETNMPQFAPDRAGDHPIYNGLNGNNGATFSLAPYGPTPIIGQYVTFKLPFSSYLNDYGPPGSLYPGGPYLQLAIYKWLVQSTSGNPGSFLVNNIRYTPT